ncbi:MAG: NifU family protein [Actinomycetota bacterium]|jgi:Fe/S biogenesis protein NfuA
MTSVGSNYIITLTPESLSIVSEALLNEAQSETLALWIEVTGIAAGAYTYDLYFSDAADATADDVVTVQDGVTVVVPMESVERLRDARLEFSSEEGGGLVLVNPNAPSPAEANPGVPAEVLAKGLTSVMAKKAIVVLESMINPSIASHGGRADLVALDDDKNVAFVRLSGGCQGCAMSRMTLSQGIEKTLREEIPELVGVVDVTDHASGENPFYEK